MKETDAELLPKYFRHKEKEVMKIIRVRDVDGKEYIEYSFVHYRLDKPLNLTHRFVPSVGRYPIPQAEYYTEIKDFAKQERRFKDIVNTETGYFIPFSKEKLDEIKNMGLELRGKVSYAVVASKKERFRSPDKR